MRVGNDVLKLLQAAWNKESGTRETELSLWSELFHILRVCSFLPSFFMKEPSAARGTLYCWEEPEASKEHRYVAAVLSRLHLLYNYYVSREFGRVVLASVGYPEQSKVE